MKEIIKTVVEELNRYEKERFIQQGYTNQAFFDTEGNLQPDFKITYKEKQNYFYIDFGTSGAFMVDKKTGEIYNIKAYGQIDKNKKLKADLGNINTITDIKTLHSKRWNYLR